MISWNVFLYDVCLKSNLTITSVNSNKFVTRVFIPLKHLVVVLKGIEEVLHTGLKELQECSVKKIIKKTFTSNYNC